MIRSLLPMLSQNAHGRTISLPIDGQPKLDGFRAIASWDGDHVRLTSRTGRLISLPHLVAKIATVLPRGVVFDGEIWAPRLGFQAISSLIKRPRPESAELQLHVFDCPIAPAYPDGACRWSARRLALESILGHVEAGPVRMVQTITIASLEAVQLLHDGFVRAGFEGLILRRLDGLYAPGSRSSALLKMKAFDANEFEVIAVREGTGKMAGAGAFTCLNDLSQATFDVVGGSISDRQAVLEHQVDVIGQRLTVRFCGRTNSGLPRFPIAVGFRLDLLPLSDLLPASAS